ncbi:Rim9p KNAG_0M02570 [Huiozyma naganishii CBS 8797]|uniref:PH-response regulator protein palI/RIM9 n=1 Tax=Huiozyma naganishii (strain ATCC MYA-139 / BCRC 22969 / CBS 8797 / KCTC 17520 / NBRC 10181 / NCYC 3082 / Yp74L-3) TaxID=1071383 RepID=J7RE40_HUIN7|nr:hypothetical protein KNAG_0M02570 [Kazachstania naganishii CBS 8797]CCK73110.1 hypothetical protein KNAG_0M02570 [Kazachstania naganishii CBS 8797]
MLRITRLRVITLLLCCIVTFHVFPIVSAPLTHINLARFDIYEYGIFGWCTVPPDRYCTDRGIGYSSNVATDSLLELTLPSHSKFSISRLLVVHFIAFALSAVLLVLCAVCDVSPKLRDSTNAIQCALLLSLTVFLFSLLSFLVDILLFTTFLNWPGWLMLATTVISAVVASMLGSLRRMVSLKNYERTSHRAGFPPRTETFPLHSLKQVGSLPAGRRRGPDAVTMSFSSRERLGEQITEPQVSYYNLID